MKKWSFGFCDNVLMFRTCIKKITSEQSLRGKIKGFLGIFTSMMFIDIQYDSFKL